MLANPQLSPPVPLVAAVLAFVLAAMVAGAAADADMVDGDPAVLLLPEPAGTRGLQLVAEPGFAFPVEVGPLGIALHVLLPSHLVRATVPFSTEYLTPP